MPEQELRYGSTEDNHLIRSALYDVVDGQCYWCHQAKQFRDTALDHIVPQHPPRGTTLAAMFRDLGLPEDSDVHDIANLALICSSCNTEKQNTDLTTVPRIAKLVQAARTRKATVLQKATRIRSAGSKQVGRAIDTLREADGGDPAVRGILHDLLPGTLRALDLIDPDIVHLPFARSFLVDVEGGARADLTLDETSERALIVLEEVYADQDSFLVIVLEAVLDELLGEIEGEAGDHFDRLGRVGDPTLETSTSATRVSITGMSFDRFDETLAVSGTIETEVDGNGVIIGDDGDGLDTIEYEGSAESTFELTLAAWSGGLCTDGCRLDATAVSLYLPHGA